ncbi:MAG: class I SAM-dependent methyltransferase [Methanomassiliicoccales archaeon]|nr:class I SAM-dependent methyltransferase [Methanomassiliicoccales archaeon]
MEGRLDPKQRFSGRASSYAKARPGYPPELFDHLFAVGALSAGCKVADLGSGTGIFSELLLDLGVVVYAIEPNQEMRELAEERLSLAPGFHSVPGCAERTTLPDGSMDAVTAAQAFHWFDPDQTREELRRVLKPSGQVIMVWNNREKEADPFNRAYSELVDRYSRDKHEIDALRQDPQERFYPFGYHHEQFHHSKDFDLAGLECLITSASYMPKNGEAGYQEMIEELGQLFAGHQVDDKVKIKYVTDCYHGSLE